MRKLSIIASCLLAGTLAAQAAETPVSEPNISDSIPEVVVTGVRSQTDVRHLSQTVSVINRTDIEQNMQPSLLPVLTEQVPGLFATARGVMGYGVSGGASGAISMRGLSGSTGQMMVLIDGHPQYMGLMGHPTADSYQSLMAERVEVLRGPASVLYGSNAMGGVVNIVTRQPQEGVQYINGLYTSVSPVQKQNFVLWNLRGQVQVCKYVSLWVRGENLLAQRYEINAGYPMPLATAVGGVDIHF